MLDDRIGAEDGAKGTPCLRSWCAKAAGKNLIRANALPASRQTQALRLISRTSGPQCPAPCGWLSKDYFKARQPAKWLDFRLVSLNVEMEPKGVPMFDADQISDDMAGPNWLTRVCSMLNQVSVLTVLRLHLALQRHIRRRCHSQMKHTCGN